jgi:hypothetical protein
MALPLAVQLGACSEATLDAVELPSTGRGPDLSAGLVAHWPLDETVGALVKDDSGGAHHGQLSGGTWLSDGRFAGALRLAPGDSVSVASFPDASVNFTVATWLRVSSAQLAMDGQTWVAILSTELFRQGGWQLNLDNRLEHPRLDFAYWSPPLDDYVFIECDCLDVDRWIHVAAVVDADANRVTLYVDGVAGDQETRPSDIEPGDSTLYFGRWATDARLFSGDLDEVSVFSRALSAEEIGALQRTPL